MTQSTVRGNEIIVAQNKVLVLDSNAKPLSRGCSNLNFSLGKPDVFKWSVYAFLYFSTQTLQIINGKNPDMAG